MNKLGYLCEGEVFREHPAVAVVLCTKLNDRLLKVAIVGFYKPHKICVGTLG